MSPLSHLFPDNLFPLDVKVSSVNKRKYPGHHPGFSLVSKAEYWPLIGREWSRDLSRHDGTLSR